MLTSILGHGEYMLGGQIKIPLPQGPGLLLYVGPPICINGNGVAGNVVNDIQSFLFFLKGLLFGAFVSFARTGLGFETELGGEGRGRFS